ncbi:MAG: MliC family protein [Hafnia alvei]|jgi:membrane-bound inhibitor of C-type lysozyme|uniref:C-type lysozyme inhibitor domain-containing protein n=1 Tax=Hafnia alvei TaxID=569 RepID=A0ABD7Q255_HAFAL|nr:MliC family protein [Hafnia alvei]NEY27750.1 lipoprotein [Escherichia coli]ANC41938.1 hypothetical protein A6V27_16935 [Hafnia alvei]KAA0263794.1 hypothetical protein ERL64_04445 [Hafnia alvei]KID05412.1 lipoprotein [Hafnia alvei]MBI0274804.1 MliC family protein [Hafnia alvei]
MLKYICTAGAMLLLAGCQTAHKEPAPEPLSYQCGTTPLTVTVDNQKDQVSFIMDGNQLTLPQVVSASGARYSDGKYTFWSKGNTAFIERNDQIIINDCVLKS